MKFAPLLTFAALVSLAMPATGVFAATANRRPASQQSSEARDRTVDEAALSAKRAAIARLMQLSKQMKGTPQEPVFLLKLAEIQHQAAAIEFRIGHGSKTNGAKHLAGYKELLTSSIGPLSTIITQYPKDSNVARAYFLRAKSYGETDQKQLAVNDFKFLINNYPMNQDLASAAFYLYDLLVSNKDYAIAIQYLKKLNPKPTDSTYTLAMDHLAWAHYYLNDLTTAVKYLELQVGFYLRKRSFNPGLLAEWERALLNAALFYSTGVANRNPDFKVDNALNSFLRLRPGKDLSKVLVHFAYLLRSKGLDEELETFKKSLLASQIKDAEAMDVLLIVLERELDRNRLDLIQETSTAMGSYLERYSKTGVQPPATYNEKRWTGVQKALTDTAGKLQFQLAQKKGTPEEGPLVPPLISLYSMLLK